MKIKLIIPALFISVNQQYGIGRNKKGYPMTFLTIDAKAYKETVSWEARKIYKKKPTKKSVKVEIWYYFPNKKRRDIGNDKLTMDSLENIIYENDSQISELHLYKKYNKKNPRTEIIITELMG